MVNSTVVSRYNNIIIVGDHSWGGRGGVVCYEKFHYYVRANLKKEANE